MTEDDRRILSESRSAGRQIVAPSCSHLERELYALLKAIGAGGSTTLLLIPGAFCLTCARGIFVQEFALPIERLIATERGEEFRGMDLSTTWSLSWFTEDELLAKLPELARSTEKLRPLAKLPLITKELLQ